MKPRLEAWKVAPDVLQAMQSLQKHVDNSGLEKSLQELVKIRASQINHCAFCLDMHTRDARAAGETEQRIYLLSAWRHSPLYNERERAALAWTEALTLLPKTKAPDEVYTALQAHFTPEEQVKLTMLISIINAWNRFGVGFRSVHAVPHAEKAAA